MPQEALRLIRLLPVLWFVRMAGAVLNHPFDDGGTSSSIQNRQNKAAFCLLEKINDIILGSAVPPTHLTTDFTDHTDAELIQEKIRIKFNHLRGEDPRICIGLIIRGHPCNPWFQLRFLG